MIAPGLATFITAAALSASFLAPPRAPNLPLPCTLHPSPSGSTTSAGVGGGGAFVSAEQNDGVLITPGYSEGWFRFGDAYGQLELRWTPGPVYVTYRVDLPNLKNGLGLAVLPTLGGRYYRHVRVSGSTNNVVAIAPSLALLMTAYDGLIHAALRYGVLRKWELESHTATVAETTIATQIQSLGVVLGSTLRRGLLAYSLEVTAQRAWLRGDLDPESGYAIVTSIGMQLAPSW